MEITNVIFCFIFLAGGIGLSLCQGLAESLMVGIPSCVEKVRQRRERRRVAAKERNKEDFIK